MLESPAPSKLTFLVLIIINKKPFYFEVSVSNKDSKLSEHTAKWMVLSRKFTFESDQIENIQINLSLDENDFKFQLFSDFLTKHVFLKSKSQMQQSTLGKSKCFKDPIDEIFEKGNTGNNNNQRNQSSNSNTKTNVNVNGNFKVNENLLQNFKIFSNSNLNNNNLANNNYGNSNQNHINSYGNNNLNNMNTINFHNFQTIDPLSNRGKTYRDQKLNTESKLLDNNDSYLDIEKDFKTLTEKTLTESSATKNTKNTIYNNSNANNTNNNANNNSKTPTNDNQFSTTTNNFKKQTSGNKVSRHKKYMSMNEFHINQDKVFD